MKHIFVSIITILFLLSCEDDNKIINNDGNPGTGKGKGSSISSSYTFDSVGIYHNQVMDDFIAKRNDFSNLCDSSSFYPEFYDELSKSYCNVGYEVPSSNCETLIRADIVTAYDNLKNLDTTNSLASLSGKFDDSEAHDELVDIISTVQHWDNGNFDSLKAIVEDWAYDIDNDISFTFTSADKDLLLKSGSILYYSLDYWSAVENDPNSPWKFDNGCVVSKKGNGNSHITYWSESLAILVSDVLGFVDGGPVGAVTSSAATAIYIFWDDILDFFGI